MSRIGNLPITIPEKAEFKLNGSEVIVKGEKGELTWVIPARIKIEQKDNQLIVKRESENIKVKALHGLVRSKVANMFQGVTEGYEKKLEIAGVGFKAEVKDQTIVLNVGLSNPVSLPILPGIEVKVEKNEISVSGIDKEVVGEMAARIRRTKKAEPYKGKGIKYKGEHIRRKAGKAAKTATA